MKTSDMPIEDIFTMIIREIEKDDAKRIENVCKSRMVLFPKKSIFFSSGMAKKFGNLYDLSLLTKIAFLVNLEKFFQTYFPSHY